MLFINIISAYIFFILLFFYCYKNNCLIDKNYVPHKKFAAQGNKNFLLGGSLLIIVFIFFYKEIEFLNIIFCILFFLLGLSSDIKLIENPKQRLVIQIIFLSFFVIFSQLKIQDTRLEVFNFLLDNIFFNFVFTIFCMMILINGINFIDGINNNVNIYILIILLVINTLSSQYNFENNLYFFNIILITILILVLINYFGIVFLGDSGSYLLGFYFSYKLIDYANLNPKLSPYFIILLIFYPCFEVLFSIIRRLFTRSNSYDPDNNHLHQLLYKFLKNKKILNSLNVHFFTTLIINISFLVFVIFGMIFYDNTKVLILLIFLKSLFYIKSYNYLKLKLSKRKS